MVVATAAAMAMAVTVTAISAVDMADTMAEDSPFTVRFRGAISAAIAPLPDARATFAMR
jgi:hypothetical protein